MLEMGEYLNNKKRLLRVENLSVRQWYVYKSIAL